MSTVWGAAYLLMAKSVEAAARSHHPVIALENNPVSLTFHDQDWRKINPELRLDTVIQYLCLWHSSQALPAEKGMKCSCWCVPWVPE